MKLIEKKNLEELFKKNWTMIFNRTCIIKQVLDDINHIKDIQIMQDPNFKIKKSIEITVTDFEQKNANEYIINIEFSVPQEHGTLIGNHVYCTDLFEKFQLIESNGVLINNI